MSGPQRYPPGAILGCSACGYEGNLRQVRAHLLGSAKCTEGRMVVIRVPNAHTVAAPPTSLYADPMPIRADTEPPDPPDAASDDEGDGGDDEGEGEGDEEETEGAPLPTAAPRTPSRSTPRSKPRTPSRPAMEVRVGSRKPVTDYIEQPIRVQLTLNLLPSTISSMEAALSHPEEFDFMEERTPSGFFDAVTEGFLALMDPEYEYELALVKRPRPQLTAVSG